MAFSNHDLVFDSPTNNFATFNPLVGNGTPSDGNLKFVPSNAHSAVGTTMFVHSSSGKWYIEYYGTGWDNGPFIIFYTPEASSADIYTNTSTTNVWAWRSSGDWTITGLASSSTGLSTWSSGDIVGVLIDYDNDGIFGFVNGSAVNSGNKLFSPSILDKKFGITIKAYNGTHYMNFGQDPTFNANKVPTKVYTDANGIGRFFHEPPTGALALCTANLAAATTAPTEYIVDETNQHLLTYNGNVTQSKFTPYATDGYSINVNGASEYLTLNSSSSILSQNDWTVEFWIYPMNWVDHQGLFGSSQGGGGQPKIAMQVATPNLMLYLNGSIQGSLPLPNLNQWTFMSFSRSSATGKLIVHYNGVNQTDINFGTSSINSNFQWFTNGEGATSGFYGYLTDGRISNIARYDLTDYNAPTQALTADGNTLHLLSINEKQIKDKTNTYTITATGSPEISDWSPFTPEEVRTGYEYRNPDEHGGGSLKFDGSGDYLTANIAGGTGSGDFTIEMWVYNTNLRNYINWFGNTRGGTGFNIGTDVNGAVVWYSNSARQIDYAAGLKNNAWYHIAFERLNGVITLYLNGVSVATYNSSTDYSDSTFEISRATVSGEEHEGYIADLRFVKGSAVYQGNFTPPTAKLSTVTNTKFLLQPYKSKITKDILNYASDETGKALTYVGNANVVNTSPYKDGVLGSFNFTGAGQASGERIDVKEIGSNFTLGTDSFTIEMWMYFTSAAATPHPLITHRYTSGNNNEWAWFVNGNSFEVNTTATVIVSGDPCFGGDSTNKWFHIVWCREGTGTNQSSFYVNGKRVINHTLDSTYDWSTDGDLLIGYDTFVSDTFKGQMSDIRIVKGQALYTADFTPPAYPLLSDRYTIDGSDPASSGTTITITGATVLLAQPGRFIKNTAEADNTDNFKAVTWTGDGTGTSRTISDVGFAADLIWTKKRSAGGAGAGWHQIYDTVRGYNSSLNSNTTNSESTSFDNSDNHGYLELFTSDGFRFTNGTDATYPRHYYNESGETYVAWCWKAGGTPSGGFTGDKAMVDGSQTTCSALATSAGASITPTAMSVNTKAGFSIVKYPAASTIETAPHGLSKKPELMIFKNLEDSTINWDVITDILNGNLQYLWLNTDDDVDNAGWGSSPTDQVMSVYNYNANMIAYCWHSVEGYSKIGSYTGNGSLDGPFVYCGFRPAWVMVKGIEANNAYAWKVWNNASDPYNLSIKALWPNLINSELSGVTIGIDFLSNGFKIRSNDVVENAAYKYIFMAFAEQPFIYSNAR